ncbi:MAG: ABC transporter permease [Roseiflexaceae bacterium]|nr:ABC transporter permease [Roseiflexaceae bacterium]
MSPTESVRIAFTSLRANKLRTALTMLGIIIGVASVVALTSIGNGASAAITGQISSIGSNLLTVFAGQQTGPGGGGGASRPLTTDDVAAIERNGIVAERAVVAASFQGSGTVTAGASSVSATVQGVSSSYFAVNNMAVERGALLSESQIDGQQSVAVLGSNVASDLFDLANPVGKKLRIEGQTFRVAGVLAAKGSSGFSSVDDQVFVPLGVAQRKLFGATAAGSGAQRVSSLSVQVGDAADIDLVQSEIASVMRRQHDLTTDGSEDDFTVFNQADTLSTLNSVTSLLTVFLGAIAGISLLVGGIGVMNIMLVSVTERTREIGLRKAVGARRRDILLQFLIEAVTLSILGGLIGLALGWLVSFLVGLTGLITPEVTPTAVALALGCSTAVGVFFGIYPAQRAAALRPIDALRYE